MTMDHLIEKNEKKHFLTIDRENETYTVDIEKYTVDDLVKATDTLGRAFYGFLQHIKEENSTKTVDVDSLSLALAFKFADSIGQHEAAKTIGLVYLLEDKHHVPKEDSFKELNDLLNKKIDMLKKGSRINESNHLADMVLSYPCL